MNYLFSEQLQSALRQANLEANALRHDYIGTEHILLSLIAQAEGPASAVLDALRIDRSSLRAWVLGRVRPGAAPDFEKGRPYTSRAKKVLEYALAAAREIGSESSGRASGTLETDHLLLGLIREEKGIAAQALQAFGATSERLAETVLHFRGKEGKGPSPDSLSTKGRVGRGFAQPGPSENQVWFVQIDPNSSTPIYEQIIARIEEAVATDLLAPGERLPTVRDLASELAVAPGTVARAYSALEERGVLETQGARGTRVAGRPASAQQKEELRPALVDLLRPIAVAAYHMGARAQDVHEALELAMTDIFPTTQA
jgi:DNA-binding transcriptional regulator YhcF (GntR family)